MPASRRHCGTFSPSAYRIGARAAWRRFAAAGVLAGLEPAVLYALAESIFDLPPEPVAVEVAAADAGGPLPRTLAVLGIAGEQRSAAASRLPRGLIHAAIGDLTCALIEDPDGPGRPAAIESAISAAGARAALGTTVNWTQARISLARARAALELERDRVGERPGLVRARERAGELLLRSDQRLAAELAADRLGPFDALTAGSRRRLTETLRVWLAEQGRLGQVAERLDIHPQTARYRLGRLRELFGDALDDPDQRFWLELALRAAPPETNARNEPALDGG